MARCDLPKYAQIRIFHADGREPSAKDILEAMSATVPLARLMDGQIAALRQWAKGRARAAANSTASSAPGNTRRLSSMN